MASKGNGKKSASKKTGANTVPAPALDGPVVGESVAQVATEPQIVAGVAPASGVHMNSEATTPKITVADVFNQFLEPEGADLVTEVFVQFKLDLDTTPEKLQQIAAFLRDQQLEATVLAKGARGKFQQPM